MVDKYGSLKRIDPGHTTLSLSKLQKRRRPLASFRTRIILPLRI